jgi:hypothetical protein
VPPARPIRRPSAFLIAVAALVAVPAARADIGDAALKVAAAKLLEQGNREFSKKDYVRALASFQQAYAKFPSPKIHLNLAFAHQKLNHFAAAAEEFDRFLQEGVYAAPTAALADARERLAAIAPKCGQMRAVGLTDAAKLDVDGAPVAVERALLHLYLDPGEHTAVASYDGKPVSRTFKLDAGATATVDLSPPVEAPPPLVINRLPPTEAPPEQERKPPPAIRGRGLIIAGAVAAGVLALGVVGTGSAVLVEHQTFVDPSRSASDRASAQRAGDALAWTSDGLLIGAVAVALATTAYGIWAHYHPSE